MSLTQGSIRSGAVEGEGRRVVARPLPQLAVALGAAHAAPVGLAVPLEARMRPEVGSGRPFE